MNKRLFTDENVTPTEALLRKHLGQGMDYYICILSKSGEYRKQWHFSRGNGWILKVADVYKALYYMIPMEEGIEISLTIRDGEREDFLKNARFGRLCPQLESAIKYSEGYALRFGIGSSPDCTSAAEFLTELMTMRAA
jgi:hypothetical protein